MPALTAARSRSPVEMCGTLSSAFSIAAWVPLPEPGAPSKTSRMWLRCGRAAPLTLDCWTFGNASGWPETVSNRPIKGDFMGKGNLLYAQSGGVTAVINATACAVIETARRKGVPVLAARNGIIGALREESDRYGEGIGGRDCGITPHPGRRVRLVPLQAEIVRAEPRAVRAADRCVSRA